MERDNRSGRDRVEGGGREVSEAAGGGGRSLVKEMGMLGWD